MAATATVQSYSPHIVTAAWPFLSDFAGDHALEPRAATRPCYDAHQKYHQEERLCLFAYLFSVIAPT
jgi:hypothetical protein